MALQHLSQEERNIILRPTYQGWCWTSWSSSNRHQDHIFQTEGSLRGAPAWTADTCQPKWKTCAVGRLWTSVWAGVPTWRSTAWMRVRVWLGWRRITSLLWRTANVGAGKREFRFAASRQFTIWQNGKREPESDNELLRSSHPGQIPWAFCELHGTKKLHLWCQTDIFNCSVYLWPQYLKKTKFFSQSLHFHPKIKTICDQCIFSYIYIFYNPNPYPTVKRSIFQICIMYIVLFCTFLHVHNKINVW